jgi:hypothetical protein
LAADLSKLTQVLKWICSSQATTSGMAKIAFYQCNSVLSKI